MVERAVRQSPILDIHTHLYDPAMGELLLWGIDEMLVYHYLLAEGFRHIQMPYENFWRLRKEEQAELIWKELFIEHSPVSEACRGVLTILHSLGLDPKEKDLPALRNWFQQWDPQAHITRCMELAGVHRIYMTNSPFDAAELAYWAKGWARDERFAAALRLDPLLLDWHNTAPQLAEQGYDVGEGLVEKTLQEIRRFLNEWTDIMEAHYVMVSLPPNFTYPSASDAAAILEGAVLPHCRERNLPLALMMGVERAVNPALRLAGDGVGRADLSALKNLCADFPGNRFLATALSRENQHELCVLARKFRNLHIFGCWWFTNTPSLIDEITRMRLELLGWSFTAQHSDARVLEHIIYKWQHTRETIAAALVDKYVDMAAAGWEPTFKEVQRDVWQLFGGAFEEFLGVRTVPEAAPDPIDWPE
ncbi:MAG: glucuronate isomerase [Verrucomicrobia bacterium]|nr:glucuronate isomerase [Verrucomicrobiota bacterium]